MLVFQSIDSSWDFWDWFWHWSEFGAGGPSICLAARNTKMHSGILDLWGQNDTTLQTTIMPSTYDDPSRTFTTSGRRFSTTTPNQKTLILRTRERCQVHTRPPTVCAADSENHPWKETFCRNTNGVTISIVSPAGVLLLEDQKDQAITGSMLDPDTTSATFSLIVTTKTCVTQWLAQIKMHFNEAYRHHI